MEYISILMTDKPKSCDKCMFCSERLEPKPRGYMFELVNKCMFSVEYDSCPIVQCEYDKMIEIENGLKG
jgi:hypothetical protein